jgi:hypothetical protein
VIKVSKDQLAKRDHRDQLEKLATEEILEILVHKEMLVPKETLDHKERRVTPE